ncbi:MAG TPA: transcriptional repressor LexA [Longimicrobiaceae bacterium]|nr:transcriptional repressor LexA [Longimicrobiaceae bacterium]
MPEPLSKMERRILDYLIDYLRRNTYQPSIREIGRRFSIKSTKTVSEYLQALADKGYIEREASRSRGVRIVGLELQSVQTVQIPYFGSISAGTPALIRDRADAEFSLDPKLVGSPDSFFLEVRGNSMDEMGILDGDLVLVEPAAHETVRDGEIVAARLGGEAAVKRYFERDGEVVLEPANPDYAPILVHEYDDFAILGRVTGLFRRFTAAQTEAVGIE